MRTFWIYYVVKIPCVDVTGGLAVLTSHQLQTRWFKHFVTVISAVMRSPGRGKHCPGHLSLVRSKEGDHPEQNPNTSSLFGAFGPFVSL